MQPECDKASALAFATLKRRGRSRLASPLTGVLLLVLAAGSTPAFSQQGTVSPEARPAGEGEPIAGGAAAGDRMGQLEEQIHDLQVMVGALESLVKSKPDAVLPQESAGGGTPQSLGNEAGLGARMDALETQIGAFTSQLEMMAQQLGALEAKLTGAGAPQPLSPRGDEPLPPPPGRQGLAPAPASERAWADAGGGAPNQLFGTGTRATTPSDADRSSEADVGAPEPLPPLHTEDEGGTPPGDRPQSLAALPEGADAASLYNQGSADLLQRDYAAAEASFRQMLDRFPQDPLAGKAQYWLGESHYVRGQFKDAAQAFLKAYKSNKAGGKGPDSLLKLGMALAALGQKEAACSAFGEFGTKFPAAEAPLRDQLRSERRKAGC
jgi:tol-pal system protein YbgF